MTSNQIHNSINTDLAYIYSVDNNDIENMQMVLRAHGHDFTRDSAAAQIVIAQAKA